MYIELIYISFDRARRAASNGLSFIDGSRYRANRYGKNFFDALFLWRKTKVFAFICAS